MNYKVRRVDSDKDQSPFPARAYSGPESVGIEYDENPGAKALVIQPGTTENSRRHLLSREMNEVVVWQDDFLGDIVDAKYTLLNGSDAEALDPAIVAGSKNGLLRLVSGDDATTTMAVNGTQLVLGLNWDASIAKGRLFMETLWQVDVITDVVIYTGFTDSIALEMPFTISGTTVTSNATDAVGFVFDTNQTTDRFYAVGVDTNTDAIEELLDTAPIAATNIRLGVELWDDGEANFYIDGVLKNTTVMTAAATPGANMTPTVAMFSETATVRNLDLDYLRVEMAR